MLFLQTFGGLALDKDGKPGAGAAGQRVRLALLAFIATAGEKGVSRDRITALFWPDSDTERAHGSLKQALFSLRRDAGEHELTLGTVMLRLNPEAIRSDVGDFQSAIAAKEWETAVPHYTGAFLEGIHLPGNAEFERWLDRERARLSQDHATALENLAKNFEAKGNYAEAVLWWRKLAATDMLSSRIARGYVRSLALSGDREAAVKYAQLYETMVRSELDTTPDPSVKRLAEELQSAPDEAVRDEGARVSPAVGVQAIEPRAPAIVTASLPAQSARSRRHIGAWVTSGIFGAAIAGYVLVFGVGASSMRLAPEDQILVGDFEAQSPDSLSARALTEVLRSSLADSRAVTIVSRSEVDQALRRMELPVTVRLDRQLVQDLAERNGYEAILTGALTPVGKGYVLSAHLTTAGGKELATLTETAVSPDVLTTAMGRLSKGLRGKIGESAAALDSVPRLEQVTTRSLRALELYQQSLDEANAGRGGSEHMMSLVREAIVVDSTFAMAHRFLGMNLYSQGSTHAAIRELRIAERFSNHLTESERLRALSSLHLVLRDYSRSADEAQHLLDHDPTNLWAINQIGILDNLLGRYEHGQEIQRKRDKVDPLHLSSLPTALTFEGRTAEALALQRQVFNRYKDSTVAYGSRQALGWLHAAAFAYDSAEYYAAPSIQSQRGDPDLIAQIQLSRGQIGKAFSTWGVRARGSEHDGTTSGFSPFNESYAAIATFVLTADRMSASRRLDAVLADAAFQKGDAADRPIGPVVALALVGRAADARRELEAIDRASDADMRAARDPELAFARGAVALAENRIPEAIAALDHASASRSVSEVCRVCALPWLGRAYKAAGRPDAAIVIYERYLLRGDTDRPFADGTWRAVILRDLGELYAQRGDTARAVSRLEQFVGLWKNADRELQPQVEAAQKRIAELRGPP